MRSGYDILRQQLSNSFLSSTMTHMGKRSLVLSPDACRAMPGVALCPSTVQ